MSQYVQQHESFLEFDNNTLEYLFATVSTSLSVSDFMSFVSYQFIFHNTTTFIIAIFLTISMAIYKSK